MPHSFHYDFKRLPKKFFIEIAKFVQKREIHKKIGNFSREIVKKFKVDKVFGIYPKEAICLVEELIDINLKNLINEEKFKKAKNKILLLPHCARKFMDFRCKAKFDKEYSSYICQSCSPDCLINKATKIAKEKNYKVFVLPGGSGIKKILKKIKPDAVIGVACPEELKLGIALLERFKIIGKGIPLSKNGCAHTKFDLNLLCKYL